MRIEERDGLAQALVQAPQDDVSFLARRRDDQELIRIQLSYKGVICHNLGGCVAQDQSHCAQHIVVRHKAIGIAESRHTRERQPNDSQVSVLDDPFDLLLYQHRGRKPGNGVEERIEVTAPQNVAHAETEFLHVKRFGDIVDGPQLQPGQPVHPLAAFCQEDNRRVFGAPLAAQGHTNFVTVNIRQMDIQNHQVGQRLRGDFQRILPPGRQRHLIAHGGEIG